jgi:hypothetical protein
MNGGNEASGDRNSPNQTVMQAPATHINAHVLKVNVNEHYEPHVSPTSKPRG